MNIATLIFQKFLEDWDWMRKILLKRMKRVNFRFEQKTELAINISLKI